MESLTIYAWLAVFATFGSYVKSAEHDCQLFTVSSCDYKDQEIILPFDLPPFSEEQCQDFCQTYTGCLHYKHTTNKTTEETLCQLFTTDYVQECDIVGGTLNTTLEECLSNDFDANSCDNWVHEDCVYPEEAIFIPYQPGDIRDEKHCQSSCHDLAGVGCKYWVYGSRQSLCTLYKQFDVYPTCAAINGPESPHYKDCIKEETTTIAQTTTPKPATACKDGWQKAAGSSMCYRKFDESKTFLDAERHCRTQGGHLARISSNPENELVGTLGGAGEFWIGLWSNDENKCHPDKNQFTWTDGTPFTGFNRWRPSQPDCCCPKSAGGMGGFFNYQGRNNLWDDDSILHHHPFVCGIPEETFQ